MQGTITDCTRDLHSDAPYRPPSAVPDLPLLGMFGLGLFRSSRFASKQTTSMKDLLFRDIVNFTHCCDWLGRGCPCIFGSQMEMSRAQVMM